MELKKTLIVVVGPTASGKSELAVKIAKKVGGEIISADSRQIYRGLNLGSGKVPGKWKTLRQANGTSKKVFVYKDIPHYLIDEASPRTQYTAAKFQKNARAAIASIFQRGKTPIICGGTAQWIDAVIYNQIIPNIKPDAKLREKLSQMSTEQMFAKLLKLDPARAADIDAKNPRRLIRALEIVITTGRPVPNLSAKPYIYKKFLNLNIKWIGLNPGMEILEKNIKKRLKARLKDGLLEEVANLHTPKKIANKANTGSGLSWKKLESFGLEYKFCSIFLQGKISREEMELLLFTAIRQYSKRQMTWWKRNAAIQWSDKTSVPLSLAKTIKK